MHKHKKPEICKHTLELCLDCDVVFCDRCQKEWGKETIVTIPNFGGSGIINVPSIPNPPYIFGDDTTNSPIVTCSSQAANTQPNIT